MLTNTQRKQIGEVIAEYNEQANGGIGAFRAFINRVFGDGKRGIHYSWSECSHGIILRSVGSRRSEMLDNLALIRRRLAYREINKGLDRGWYDDDFRHFTGIHARLYVPFTGKGLYWRRSLKNADYNRVCFYPAR